jgi:hypothetical protein
MKEILRAVEDAPPIKLFVGPGRETRRYMFVHARENAPLPSLLDLDNETQREVLESPDFLRLTFVRNPYTRLVSAWKDKVMLCEPDFQHVHLDVRHGLPELHAKSLITFAEFIDYIANQPDVRTWDPHWQRQIDHIFLSALNFSFVGKVERMAEGLQRFERHLGLSKPLAVDARNVSGSTGSAVYDPIVADKVYSLYEGDFNTLGYDRDSWPRGRQDFAAGSQKAVVAEDRFNDEVVERNIVIALLYQERAQLQANMRRVNQLHLLAIANVLLVLPRLALKFTQNMRTWIDRLWRRDQHVQRRPVL